MLPDVALLGIFDLYVDEAGLSWYVLVHVCQKWRNVVFGSPRRLGLKLHCGASTPVRETLDVWPLLPIVIEADSYDIWDVENIIAALEHKDRICDLELYEFSFSQFKKVLKVMKQPFPALTHLRLWPKEENVLHAPIPASFLGGSAPQLRTLVLAHIPFPEIPKLLLSATHLVTLSLQGISRSWYISPETMLTCLSVLTRLVTLGIGFRSVLRRKSQTLPLPTRTQLPILSNLSFEGPIDYLEDLVARIDAPLLHNLDVTFYNQLIFDTPGLTQFISRTPKLKAYDTARVFFSDSDAWVILSQTSTVFHREFELRIAYKSKSDEQVSSLAQICSLSFPQPLIATVEHLYVLVFGSDWQPEDDIENDQWLELLHPFTAVKNVYIPLELTPSISLALQDLVGERTAEVLPALQTLFLEDNTLFPSPPTLIYYTLSPQDLVGKRTAEVLPTLQALFPSLPGVQDAIGQFAAARQLSGHPFTVSPWDGDDGIDFPIEET